MSRLTVLSDAVTHLAALLHAHGPACVCAACTACQQALVLYPRLAHLLAVLEAWSTTVWEEGEDEMITQEELGEALRVLNAPPPRPRGGTRDQGGTTTDPHP